jgi:pyruvate decarboxylase
MLIKHDPQIYVGSISHPDIKEKVEGAKLILSVGALKSDFNTGNFTYSIRKEATIEVSNTKDPIFRKCSTFEQLHSDHTLVKHAHFPAIGMKDLIPKLTARLHHVSPTARHIDVPAFVAHVPDDGESVISHAWFWPRMSAFFRPKDVIVAETGTSSFGVLDVPMPEGCTFVSQILWGSIGWTVGSTLGAALAARERGLGRTILFVGDGSMCVYLAKAFSIRILNVFCTF